MFVVFFMVDHGIRIPLLKVGWTMDWFMGCPCRDLENLVEKINWREIERRETPVGDRVEGI